MGYLIACSRWAFLTSGFIFFLAMMSVIEAPTIGLENFWVRRVRFFVCSSSCPFLCLRLSQVMTCQQINKKNTHVLGIFLIYQWALMQWHTLQYGMGFNHMQSENLSFKLTVTYKARSK